MNIPAGYVRAFLNCSKTYLNEILMFFTMNPMKSSRSSGACCANTGNESEKHYSRSSLFTPKHMQEKVAAARQKFGRPFVHEKGTDWKPNSTPFLTRYFQQKRPH